MAINLRLRTACITQGIDSSHSTAPLAETIDHLLEAAARYPLLTAAQEIELGRQIRAWQDWEDGPDAAPPRIRRRGERALEKFLLCNLRLAHYIARRYQNRGVPMEDLMQAATEGLHAAYKRFEPAKGYRSSSYACWWAQQACQVIVAQQGNGIRLPTTASEQMRKLARLTRTLTEQLRRAPTELELEAAMELKPGGLTQLRQLLRRADVISLDQAAKAPLNPDKGSLIDLVKGNDDPAAALEQEEIRTVLSDLVQTSPSLNPQQRYLLQCRYFTEKPPTIARLASQLNMNRETLRRMEKQALEVLRGLLGEKTWAYRDVL
jgi:RNA polymerase sigma factor (sigma-70 family)